MITITPILKITHQPNIQSRHVPKEQKKPTEKIYTIYKLTCRSTNKSYVGCTSNLNDRLSGHISNSRNSLSPGYHYPISTAIREHGIEDFDLQILDTSDDKDFAFDTLEPCYVELHKGFTEGYNETKGGLGAVGFRTTPKQVRARKKTARRDLAKIKQRLKGLHKDTKWITDGLICRRISKHARVPDGFRTGRPARLFKKAA